MTLAVRSGLLRLLTQALSVLGLAASKPPERTITAAHLTALPRFLELIPVRDLVALASGTGNADNAFHIAEAGASMVARAFPAFAIPAEQVRLGMEALQFFVDAAGLGALPFKIEPGYRPLRDGFAGARGHI